jgi:hypothetical protein
MKKRTIKDREFKMKINLISIAAALVCAAFASPATAAMTYTFDSSRADWYSGANAMTAAHGVANGLITYTSAPGATNKIYVDCNFAGIQAIDAGDWAGATWSAPAGQVVTKVTISGYFGHDNAGMFYGVQDFHDGTYTGYPILANPATFAIYTNVAATISVGDQVNNLRLIPYFNGTGAGVTGAGTDYPQYRGEFTTVVIETIPEPASFVLLGLLGAGVMSRRRRNGF